jgi:hypothetical protein
MTSSRGRRPRRLNFLLFLGLISASAAPLDSAYAMKNRTIVLRATGSGAVLGLAAGLVSYPFAKSTGTILAGAVVGALLGTVYGYYLVDRRDEMYRTAARRTELDALFAINEERNAMLRGRAPSREFSASLPVLSF